MSAVRDRPKGLTPAPLKPRLAANIATTKSTPPSRFAARSHDPPSSPATGPTRKPLIATSTANARQSPAIPSTAAAKGANPATPTTRPFLRAARPESIQSSPIIPATNARAQSTATPNGTVFGGNKTLRKAPSAFFSPNSTRSNSATPNGTPTDGTKALRKAPSSFFSPLGARPDSATSNATPSENNKTLRKAPSSFFSPNSARSQLETPPSRPPLTKKTSSFVYANGETEDLPATSDSNSDAHSVRSGKTEKSMGFVFSNRSQRNSNASVGRSQVGSPLLSPRGATRVINSVPPLLSPVPVPASSAPLLLSPAAIAPDPARSAVVSPVAKQDTKPEGSNAAPVLPKAAQNAIKPADSEQLPKPVTPVQQIARVTSPAESEASATDSTPHVVRSTMTVDFPTKLPSPARRRSMEVNRRIPPSTSNFSPGHRKIQSVSTSATPPPRLSRIDTGIPATITSEPIVDSPVASRLPRLSIDGAASAALAATAAATIEEEGQTPGSTKADSETSGGTNAIGAARHERKLLDLEISNSSLLAINRSLEREVLKQKSELRRMRRATRGGIGNRMSWLSEVSTSDDIGEMGFGSSPDVDSPDQSVIMEEIDTPTRSYGQTRQSDINPTSKINLDLAKHKDILIDSQKMNLSIQRCLGMTEQLLKDAGAALAYEPQVSSRVLTPAEKEQEVGDETEVHTDTPNEVGDYFTQGWDWAASAKRHGKPNSDGTTDKDSGVDLDDDLAHRYATIEGGMF